MTGHADPPEDSTGKEFADAYAKPLNDALEGFYRAFEGEMDSHEVNEAFDVVCDVMAEMEAKWDRRLTRREG